MIPLIVTVAKARAYLARVTSLVSGFLATAAPAQAQNDACAGGPWIFCDDFTGSTIDATKWIKGNTNIGNKYKVRPANLLLTTANDNGNTITVVDARMFGDMHAKPRQGGVLITRRRYGGGRYEVRMKNLPGPYGCSCFWNYYDSENEANPPPVRIYTEIDIEMPANIRKNPPAWATWRRTLGFNTWADSDADEDATYIQHVSPINPFDGQFHTYRWDWRDGGNGARRIDWYVDGVWQSSTMQHVGTVPAQLWVGTWPAPWPGMNYNFSVKHAYIDWVRISPL